MNRALLARQHLSRRAEIPVAEALERLIALQAQAAQAPYFALWARLKDFAPPQLSDRLEDFSLVRGTLIRGTLHLATAPDFAAIRPLIQRGLDGVLTDGSVHGRALAGLDPAKIAAMARSLLRRGPLTTAELRDALAEHWPGRDPQALAMAARVHLPMLQLPPRGLWGRSGQPTLAAVEDRLAAPEPGFALADLVRRYLAAFGPASVADAQAWLGLSRLASTFEALRPSLAVFRSEDGVDLFDLPEAERPPGDAETPVRFLGEFDNVLLAHDDRTRIMSADHKRRLYTPNGILRATVLVDGFTAGRWRIEDGKTESILHLDLFSKPAKAVARDLTDEGERLMAFAAKHAGGDIRIQVADA
ncbi:winged helix DNA-binding domain-containing protein [Caulobacter sp. BK020]|uniref:winged helix DNA-binding domain-containing protein n=1 Tax=Caulobacter sp. BK020 TaxID=2512117 RepID=UPI0010E1C064|nr:winged helix DNA-binding domain-containing protein [Caulobacter sp. BK020]TCS17340.1 winged helix DNA-binding protein [Caulobacter sp. BK020]